VGPGVPVRFTVLVPPKWVDALKVMAAGADRIGRRAEFVANLKELDYRLTCEADDWGESREYLPVLDLEIRFGVVGLITVWYAVGVATRAVYVKTVRLRGGLES
jgi:hypothetical protein